MRKHLKAEEDAYGQEMWAFYNGKEAYEIVERDDGYISCHPLPKMYFSKYEEWFAHEKKLYNSLGEKYWMWVAELEDIVCIFKKRVLTSLGLIILL